jgi:hypothetical protein
MALFVPDFDGSPVFFWQNTHGRIECRFLSV